MCTIQVCLLRMYANLVIHHPMKMDRWLRVGNLAIYPQYREDFSQ